MYQGGDWGSIVSVPRFHRLENLLTSAISFPAGCPRRHPLRGQARQGLAHQHAYVRPAPLAIPLLTSSPPLSPHSVRPPAPFSNPLLWLGMFLIPFDSGTRARFAATKAFGVQGRGYFVEQATKPQTLGSGLADSPVGLLAWIYPHRSRAVW